MAYRTQLNFDSAKVSRLRELGVNADRIVEPILRDAANLVKQYAVQNLSGVPFTSETGTHVINKRSGLGAAAIQVELPYGSPFRARIFAFKNTRYADNPEEYNYLDILERGRGEVRPKYTPAMRNGFPDRARLAIPVDDGNELVFGVKGFRGRTGRYVFLKSLPPVEGKYWMKSAVASAEPQLNSIASQHLDNLINNGTSS
jgi:hypothetical protein